MTGLAGPLAGLRKENMQCELLWISGLQKSQFGCRVEDKNRLGIVDPHPIQPQAREGIFRVWRQMALPLSKREQRPPDLKDVLHAFFAQPSLRRVGIAVG